MSLGCGEGREIIRGDFSLVYLLGTNKKGLTFPDKKKDIVPPNSAVCSQHLRKVPEDEFRDSPRGIRGTVYGLVTGSGEPIYEGEAVSFAGVRSGPDFKYLTRAIMEKYLPGALEIIASFHATKS